MKLFLIISLAVAGVSAPASGQAPAPTSTAQADSELTCEQINAEANALSPSLLAEQKSQQGATLEGERKTSAKKRSSLFLGPLGSALVSRKKSPKSSAADDTHAQKRMDELVALSSRKGC
jgi:invasion protein IalB